jgi:hypothetical protein
MHEAINVGDIVKISDSCRFYEKRYNGMIGYVTRVDLNANTRYVHIFEDRFSNRGEIFFSFHHLMKVDSKNGLG